MARPAQAPAEVLDLALQMLQPWALWMVRSGLGHAQVAQALKPLFLAAAQAEQARQGRRQTDSALSLLSGLHRKDVRALGQAAASQALSARAPATPANQVLTQWLSRRWPRQLPLSAAGRRRSFDGLARSVSRDVHPRTLLNELLRLQLVREQDGQVERLVDAIVPPEGALEAVQWLSASVHDHLAAGVHNLTHGEESGFLEQSLWADGLHPDSVQRMGRLANQLWQQVLAQGVRTVTPMAERDEASGGKQRIRLGMYFYTEAMPDTPVAPPPSPPSGPSPRRARRHSS